MKTRNSCEHPNPFQRIAAARLFELCEGITKACHGRDACAAGIRLHYLAGSDLDTDCYSLSFERDNGDDENFRIDRDGVWSDAEVLNQCQTDAAWMVLSRHFAYTTDSVNELFRVHREHTTAAHARYEERESQLDGRKATQATMRALIIDEHLLV